MKKLEKAALRVFKKSDAIPLIAEVFRELGYEGASLSNITERTGLGRSSLYHFFPGGKDEMASEILAHVDKWFVNHIFQPLEKDDPREAIAGMWIAVDDYFKSGLRVCLVGAFALDETRDRFENAIQIYFKRWITALRDALVRAGKNADTAAALAETTVAGIQGALVLARATKDEGLFLRILKRMANDCDVSI